MRNAVDPQGSGRRAGESATTGTRTSRWLSAAVRESPHRASTTEPIGGSISGSTGPARVGRGVSSHAWFLTHSWGAGHGLAVARRLRRRSVGIDLNPRLRGSRARADCRHRRSSRRYEERPSHDPCGDLRPGLNQGTVNGDSGHPAIGLLSGPGWTDVAVFRDDGISGVRDNRPELDKLRERMLHGEFCVGRCLEDGPPWVARSG